MEPFSLQCSVSVRCTLRQKFLRLLFVLQFGWYFHTARQGVPHPCGPVQPHIAFAPDSPALQLQNLRSCQGFGQSSFQLSRWAFPFLPCAILTSVCMPESLHLCGDHDSCPPDFSANPLHGRSEAYTPRFRKPVLHHLNSDIFGAEAPPLVGTAPAGYGALPRFPL